jgi:flavin-dependent dehydrogenase
MARVAIVGAGPAGSVAGHRLATRGHAVTLFDRAAFPRPKTCGDWIAEGAIDALASSGLGPEELTRAASEYAVLTGSLLGSPRGETSEVRHSRKAYCIPRLVFDDILFRRARGAGCEFVRQEVRDLRPGHRGVLDEFDHVIDARGVRGGAPNGVALRAYWTVNAAQLPPAVKSTVQLFADDVFRRGYGWIFPVATTGDRLRLNVGVGMWKADSRGPGRNVAAYYEKFVSTHAAMRELSRHVLEKSRPQGYHVAMAEWRNRVAGDGVLRVGDAANLTDPLTGEGIANAVRSGLLVADAIDSARSAPEAERAWQRLYETVFARDLRAALAVRMLLASTRGKNAAMWLMKRRPGLAERFHASLAGAHPWHRLLSLNALLASA